MNDALWRCKSDDEKEELLMNFLKDTKKRKREALVTSNDGKFSVISKAKTVARKANQHKRPRNERTRKR